MIPELLNLLPKLDKESGIWRVEIGWTYITGDGSSTAMAGSAITFQEAFAEAPFMFGTCIGQMDTAGGDPVDVTSFDLASQHDLVPYAVSTTGFTPYYTKFNTVFSGSRHFGASWIAFGKKA